ncbi:MAG: hypothetical protein O2930_07310 [Acidobacteria bacterium]|nr:hypothetical protein [Acidobacteriota bacterium]
MTAVLFVALVLLMAVLVGLALLRAGQSDVNSHQQWTYIGGFVVLYLAVPAVLATTGRLDRYDPMPAPALVMVPLLTLVTVRFATSSVGARVGSSVGLATLVGFQVFRLPVEWLLHRLSVEQVIPQVMTYSGRNFDIVSGVTGGLLGVWLLRRSVPSWVLVIWNLTGLALLGNIVLVATLSTPALFRVFTEGPPNLLPSTFPFVWLPSFLVQLALVGHLLLFRCLRSGLASINARPAIE